MPEYEGSSYGGNYDPNAEWERPMGRDQYYNETDARDAMADKTSGHYGDPFYDNGVEEIRMYHYDVGEVYGYYNQVTREWEFETLTKELWAVEYYGNPANISP